MTSGGDRGFVTRMEKSAKLAGNAMRLAEKSGISRRAIGDYLAGKAEPSRPRLIAIACAAGVRVEWLAIGEGTMLPQETGEISAAGTEWTQDAAGTPADEALVRRVAAGIERIHREENARIPGPDLAVLTQRMVSELTSTYEIPEERHIGLKLLLQQLKRTLREPTYKDKRSA